MKTKDFIKGIIAKLEDDIQHYTMVEKDKVKAKLLNEELKQYQKVLEDLVRYESSNVILKLVLEKDAEDKINKSISKCPKCNFVKILEDEKENQSETIKKLKEENKDLKRRYNSHDFLYQNEVSQNGKLTGKILEKNLRIKELESKIQELEENLKTSMNGNRGYSKKVQELENKNRELKQEVKDVMEDYQDAAKLMFELDEAIEILSGFNFTINPSGQVVHLNAEIINPTPKQTKLLKKAFSKYKKL